MNDEKRGRGRPRKETMIMPTTLESKIKETEEQDKKDVVLYPDWAQEDRLYSLATRIYVAMIEREPFLANNTDTAESAIRRAKIFLSVWEKEGQNNV